MTRVIIADDHPIILSGAEALLRNSNYEIVAKLSNGVEALEAVREQRPDILIVDVQMPVCTGLDVLRTLRTGGDDLPVVLLTAGLDDRSVWEAMQLGVNGMVLKDTAAESLLSCLEAVRAGGEWIDEALASRVANPAAGNALESSSFASLSQREAAVAALVVQGLRNREIAMELGITEGTVKIHLHKVYEKLGVGSRTELVIYAKG